MAGSFVNDTDLVLGDETGLVLGGSSNNGEEGQWWVQFLALAPSSRQAQALHMWWAVASFLCAVWDVAGWARDLLW